MKIKNIVLIVSLAILTFSCKKDKTTSPFDYAKQALIDDDSLVNYLDTHYYNATLDSIKKVDNGQTPFSANVQVETVVENDVTYKLYYIISEQGVGYQPTKYDKVLPNYRLEALDGEVYGSQENVFTVSSWYNLSSNPLISQDNGAIAGWIHGIPKFKAGINASMPNQPLVFENYGKGFLFIPSGLAYGVNGKFPIPPNAPLIFKIELLYAIEGDFDNDNVVSNDEDIDGDGDVTNDDTDEDGTPNYIDVDDDGDGVLTKDEDVNEDDNPMNDDTDGDGTPNYLDNDDDGDGILTIDEDANNDGNLLNDDSDGDNIPNYLDADS